MLIFDRAPIGKDVLTSSRAKFSGRGKFSLKLSPWDANFKDASSIADVHFVRAVFEGDVLTFRDRESDFHSSRKMPCRRTEEHAPEKTEIGKRQAITSIGGRDGSERRQKPGIIADVLEYVRIQSVLDMAFTHLRVLSWLGY